MKISDPRIIYKYSIESKPFVLQLPEDAEILKVGIQNDEPKMWVLQDKWKPLVIRMFCLIATGQRFDYNDVKKYIDTIFLKNSSLVFHLFELNNL